MHGIRWMANVLEGNIVSKLLVSKRMLSSAAVISADERLLWTVRSFVIYNILLHIVTLLYSINQTFLQKFCKICAVISIHASNQDLMNFLLWRVRGGHVLSSRIGKVMTGIQQGNRGTERGTEQKAKDAVQKDLLYGSAVFFILRVCRCSVLFVGMKFCSVHESQGMLFDWLICRISFVSLAEGLPDSGRLVFRIHDWEEWLQNEECTPPPSPRTPCLPSDAAGHTQSRCSWTQQESGLRSTRRRSLTGKDSYVDTEWFRWKKRFEEDVCVCDGSSAWTTIQREKD